ncbi:MAG: PHP domain-containing protein [Gemmatimonadota bacterium]|nr:PHP domain-containing protein [Gemmatimonadota bacterium]
MPTRKHTSPLAADHHVHSTFSDGRGTPEDNLSAARGAGLARLGFVDHVRADSGWLPAYTAHIRALAATSEIEITCGVEAKILDLDGTLDLPADLRGIDRVVVADHQMPGAKGPIRPIDARIALEAGALTRGRVVDDLVTATEAALNRHEGVLLAHLFSVLPKMGLSEDDVTDDHLFRLVEAASRSGAAVEVSERWRCPTLRVTRAFFAAGVAVVPSSDAHEPRAIGEYDYVSDVFAAIHGDLEHAEVA